MGKKSQNQVFIMDTNILLHQYSYFVRLLFLIQVGELKGKIIIPIPVYKEIKAMATGENSVRLEQELKKMISKKPRILRVWRVESILGVKNYVKFIQKKVEQKEERNGNIDINVDDIIDNEIKEREKEKMRELWEFLKKKNKKTAKQIFIELYIREKMKFLARAKRAWLKIQGEIKKQKELEIEISKRYLVIEKPDEILLQKLLENEDYKNYSKVGPGSPPSINDLNILTVFLSHYNKEEVVKLVSNDRRLQQYLNDNYVSTVLRQKSVSVYSCTMYKLDWVDWVG